MNWGCLNISILLIYVKNKQLFQNYSRNTEIFTFLMVGLRLFFWTMGMLSRHCRLRTAVLYCTHTHITENITKFQALYHRFYSFWDFWIGNDQSFFPQQGSIVHPFSLSYHPFAMLSSFKAVDHSRKHSMCLHSNEIH